MALRALGLDFESVVHVKTTSQTSAWQKGQQSSEKAGKKSAKSHAAHCFFLRLKSHNTKCRQVGGGIEVRHIDVAEGEKYLKT
jgi:hypothetical protein